MKRGAKVWLIASCLLVVGGGGARSATAGGFAIAEQSASSAGSAVAGAVVVARDASTVFYNPAGMVRLSAAEAVVASGFVVPMLRFENRGTRDATGALVTGNETINNSLFVVPSLYLAVPVSRQLSVGFGLNAPFGESVSYDRGWVGRYSVVEASLTTLNLNPAVAYRVTDWLSVGVGFNAQYAQLERVATIDFGSVCFGIPGLGPGVCPFLGLVPQGADGRVKLTADDWGFGYNLGLLLEPTSKTRIGLAYRSEIHHTLTGRAEFVVPPAASVLTAGGTVFRDTRASVQITFPSSLSIGALHEFSDQWAVFGSITWTEWSRIHTTTVRFDNPAQPPVSQKRNWTDTLRYAMGLSYTLDPSLMLQGGIAFDESPVSDRFRTADIPVGARISAGVGVSYRIADSISVDVSYTYTHQLSSGAQGVLIGKFEGDYHAVSAQLAIRF